MCSWLDSVASLIVRLEAGEGTSTRQAAKSLGTIVFGVLQIVKLLKKDTAPESRLQGLVELWVAVEKAEARSAAPLPAAEPFSLLDFAKALAWEDTVPKAFEKWVFTTVRQEPPAAFVKKFAEIEDCMPQTVKPFLPAAAVAERLDALKKRVEAGQCTGATSELSAALLDVREAQHLCPRIFESWAKFKTDYDVVKAEYDRDVMEIQKRAAAQRTQAQGFEAKYGATEDAVATWNFSKCPWLRESNDKECELAVKKMLRLTKDAPATNTIVTLLGKRLSRADAADVEAIRSAQELCDDTATSLETCKRLVMQLTFAGIFIFRDQAEWPDAVEQSLKIANSLSVFVGDMPEKLSEKITGVDDIKPKDENATTPTPVTGEKGPAKKLRKLGGK